MLAPNEPRRLGWRGMTERGDTPSCHGHTEQLDTVPPLLRVEAGRSQVWESPLDPHPAAFFLLPPAAGHSTCLPSTPAGICIEGDAWGGGGAPGLTLE